MKPSQRRNIINRALRQLERSPVANQSRSERITFKFFSGSTIIATIASFNLALALSRLKYERGLTIARNQIEQQWNGPEYTAVLLKVRQS